MSQQSRRSKGSCPIEVVEGLLQITHQQRDDAVWREAAAIQEKQSLRDEAARR